MTRTTLLYLLSVLSLIALASIPDRALAWGQFGHLAVCDLAYRNLTDTSQEKLKKLFNGKKGITVKGKGKLPDRFYTAFNVGCLEEDALPRKHANDHFINVSRDTKSIDGPSCPNNGDCIFGGLARDLDTLKDESASNEDRVMALMAIGHWVGDIHQPLHISFADDKGGNGINVELEGKCGTSSYRVSNLHGLWDNCLLEAGLFQRVREGPQFKKTWSKNTITYRAVDALLARTTLTEEKAFVASEPWQWAEESYRITLDAEVGYCVMVDDVCRYSVKKKMLAKNAVPRSEKIGQSYLESFEGAAEERVRMAGFRLAHLLNLALDPNYTEPLQDSTQEP